ncbi:MAG: AI-2E family transporter [Candidatus Spechtbacterales bacterium]
MTHEPHTTIDISAATLLRVLAMVGLVVLFFAIWQILAGVFLAIVISAALEPTLRWLERHRVHRYVSVPAIYLVASGMIAGIFYAVIPTLFAEVRTLSQELPQRIDVFFQGLDSSTLGNFSVFVPSIEQTLVGLQGQLGAVGGDVLTFASSIFGGLVSFFFVVIISFYLSLERDAVQHFLTSFTPVDHREYISDLWRRIQRRLGRWLQAQFVMAVFIGVSTFIILTILGSPFALTIGILAGFLEIIPLIGPIIAGAIMFGIVSLDSIVLALIAVAVYMLIQQIQQNFIIPAVMSRIIGLNPLIILVSVLVAAELAGMWGIVLAIPLVAVLREIIRDVQQEEK